MKYIFELPNDFDITKCLIKLEGNKLTADMPLDDGRHLSVYTYISSLNDIEEPKKENDGEGLLVLQCPGLIKPSAYEDTYNSFLQQKAMGVVLLPPGYKALYIPKDVEIKMEEIDD